MNWVYNFYAAIVLVVLSLIALVYNEFGSNYPGNFYYFPAPLVIELNLLLFFIGFYILLGPTNKFTLRTKEFSIYIPLIACIILATNAVQYTPFEPVDPYLLAFDKFFNIDMHMLLQWTQNHPLLNTILETIYISLSYQIGWLPPLLIMMGYHKLIREHVFLMLVTSTIGFSIYYFFPSTAPASIIDSNLFNEMQKATGLKFYQLHHYIQPTTDEGGMISLPSFHIIWAWLCVYLIRNWPIACSLLAMINIILVISTILLGWHYVIDILGSLVTIVLGHGLYHYANTKSKPVEEFSLLTSCERAT